MKVNIPADSLLNEACRILAYIATSRTNSHSNPDAVAIALDDAETCAKNFFRRNDLDIDQFWTPPYEPAEGK